AGLAFDWNGGGHEPIRITRVFGVRGHIHARLGIELDECRRVRDRYEAVVFGVECKVAGAWRGHLLVVEIFARSNWTGMANLLALRDSLQRLYGRRAFLEGALRRSWRWRRRRRRGRRWLRCFLFLQLIDFFLHLFHGLLHGLQLRLEVVQIRVL